MDIGQLSGSSGDRSDPGSGNSSFVVLVNLSHPRKELVAVFHDIGAIDRRCPIVIDDIGCSTSKFFDKLETVYRGTTRMCSMKIENSDYVVCHVTRIDVQLLGVFRVLSRRLVGNMLGLLRVGLDRRQGEAGCDKAGADSGRLFHFRGSWVWRGIRSSSLADSEHQKAKFVRAKGAAPRTT